MPLSPDAGPTATAAQPPNRMYPTLTGTAVAGGGGAGLLRGNISALPSRAVAASSAQAPVISTSPLVVAANAALVTNLHGVGSNLRVLRQGWLYKRGPFYQPWRLRWCMIAQREDSNSNNKAPNSIVLVVYSQRDHAMNGHTQPKVVIPLAVQLEVEVPFNPVKRAILDRTQLFPFVFVIHGRKHVFASNHRKDREDWIHLVQSLSDSPFAAPRPISAIPEPEECSILEATSVVDGGVTSSYASSTMASTFASGGKATASQLGYSAKMDMLSIADTEVLTEMELSELGRPSSPVPKSNYSSRPSSPTAISQSIPSHLLPPSHPWNDTYQRLCDQPCTTNQAQVQCDLALAELLGQFSEVSRTLAIKVIDDYHMSTSLPPTSSSNESWIFGNIVVSMAADYSNPDETIIRASIRKSAHELQATSALAAVTSDLHTPLTCLVDYKGFRLVCSAAVPLDPANTLVLDIANGKHDVTALEKLAEAGTVLNLAEHGVGTSSTPVKGSALVNIHYARTHDHYYATRLADMFPVDLPKPDRPVDPTRRLRPEFVKGYKHPLSSNAYNAPQVQQVLRMSESTNPGLVGARKDVVYASRYLRENHVPEFVTRLDRLDVLPCDGIGLTNCLHANGINVRYLGLIATRTRLPAVKELCLVEMVGRAAKEAFVDKVRGCVLHFRRIGATKIENELVRVAVEFVNEVLSGDEKMWEDVLKPVVQRKFSFVMGAEIFKALSRRAVLMTLAHHCGIDLVASAHLDVSSSHALPTLTASDFRGFIAKPKSLTPPRHGRQLLTSVDDRATYDLAVHLALRGPASKLSACSITQRRLVAVARAALVKGKYTDSVKYGMAAVQAGPWKSSVGTARAWAVVAEAAWGVQQGKGEKSSGNGEKDKLGKSGVSTIAVTDEKKQPSTTTTTTTTTGGGLMVAGRTPPPSSLPTASTTGSPRGGDSNETLVASPSRTDSSPSLIPNLRPIPDLTSSALAAVAVHWGADHPLVIDIHARLARASSPYSPSRTLDHHARALRAAVRSLGRTHPVTSRVQLVACLQLVSQGRAQEAARMANDALSALGGGDGNPEGAHARERALAHAVIAEAMGVLGDLASARSHAAKARVIRERVLGWAHPLTADACAQVAALAVQAAGLSGKAAAELAVASTTAASAAGGKMEIVTPAARADMLAAVEAYGRVFKYLKARSAGTRVGASGASVVSQQSSVDVGGKPEEGGPDDASVAPEVQDESTLLANLSLLALIGTAHTSSSANKDVDASDPLSTWGSMLRQPNVVCPVGLAPNAALLKLARTLVALKLRVIQPTAQQHVRLARQRAQQSPAVLGGEVMRDIMARLVGLTPAVFVDDCLQRAEEGEEEAVEELAVVVALVEKGGA